MANLLRFGVNIENLERRFSCVSTCEKRNFLGKFMEFIGPKIKCAEFG